MSYDISQSVSQGSSGEETAENRRIHEIADELRRRCQLYEAQLRDSQDNVGRFEVEQRVAEQFAKENGMWIPMSDVFDLGVPGPSGNENDTYVSNDIIYNEGRFANEDYTVWDLVPRNVLRDQDGDIFIIDAEIAKHQLVP